MDGYIPSAGQQKRVGDRKFPVVQTAVQRERKVACEQLTTQIPDRFSRIYSRVYAPVNLIRNVDQKPKNLM